MSVEQYLESISEYAYGITRLTTDDELWAFAETISSESKEKGQYFEAEDVFAALASDRNDLIRGKS